MVRFQKSQIIITLMLIGIILFSIILNYLPLDVIEAKNAGSTVHPKRNFNMVSFFWTVGIVGGCIAVTLSYVSFKKYRNEVKKQEKKSLNS